LLPIPTLSLSSPINNNNQQSISKTKTIIPTLYNTYPVNCNNKNNR